MNLLTRKRRQSVHERNCIMEDAHAVKLVRFAEMLASVCAQCEIPTSIYHNNHIDLSVYEIGHQ